MSASGAGRARILRSAEDVDEQVREIVIDALDWFEGEPLRTQELIDRVAEASNHAITPFDIESYDNPATRKIMRIARAARRGS